MLQLINVQMVVDRYEIHERDGVVEVWGRVGGFAQL